MLQNLIINTWEIKLMKKILTFLKHKEDLLYIAALFVIISAFFVHAEDAFEVTSEPMEMSEAISFSDRTDEIVQELKMDGITSITEISIQFGTYEKTNQGTLHIHLFENERSIAKWQLDTTELADNAYHEFSLAEPLEIQKKNSYFIHLSDDFKGDNAVALWTSSHPKGMCYHNGIPLNKTSVCYQLSYIDAKLRKKVLMIALIIFLVITALLALSINEVLVMGTIFVTLGCVYMWLCPLYMAPDEEHHFFRAFEISCGDLISPQVLGNNGGNMLPSALGDSSTSDTIDWDDTECFVFSNVSLYAHVSYSRRDRIQKREIAVITALCMTVSLCKVVYIVLVLLVFMIPEHKIGTGKKGLILKFSIFGVSVILNLIWLKISSGYLIEFTPSVDSPKQVQYVLSHIGDFYGIVLRTPIEKGDFFLQTMFGSHMGALSIEITPSVWIAFLILFLYEICSHKRLGAVPHKYDQLIMALVFLGDAGLICASLYVQWTSLENEIIEGIQGRYFIPLIIFPALLIVYNNDKKKRETRYIITDNKNKNIPLMILLTLNGITILDMIQFYLA